MFASGQFYAQVLNKVIKDAQRKANVHIVLEFDQCNTRFMVQEAIIEREVRPAGDFTVRLDERWCDYDKFQKLHMFLLLHSNHEYVNYIHPVYTLENKKRNSKGCPTFSRIHTEMDIQEPGQPKRYSMCRISGHSKKNCPSV
uniref:Uncharacterized protein n=1 Tax=Glycine max TaxID=3847 RepID=A0A0R0JR47_SOYBN